MSIWRFATDKKERELRTKLETVKQMRRKDDNPFLEQREAELQKELDAIVIHKAACRGIVRKHRDTHKRAGSNVEIS